MITTRFYNEEPLLHIVGEREIVKTALEGTLASHSMVKDMHTVWYPLYKENSKLETI